MSYGNSNSPTPMQYPSGNYLPNDQPPRKSSNTIWWVLGILGVLGVGALAVCCGGGYMMYTWGTGMIAEAIKPQIENDPSIQEHIGEIQSMSMDFGATQQRQGDEVMVFIINGNKGNGQLELKDTNGENGPSCVLVLPDGRRFDVVVEQEADWSEDDFNDGQVEEPTDSDAEANMTEEPAVEGTTGDEPSNDSPAVDENKLPKSEPASSL